MRILYVYDVIARFGGMERVIVDKMNCFSKMGNMEVYLITTNQGQHPVPFELDSKVHYEDLKVQTHLQYRYRGLRRLWERFRRNKMLNHRMADKIQMIQPNVLICTTSRLVSTMVKLKRGIPLVAESHSDFENVMENEGNSLWSRIKAKRHFRKLQKVTAIVTLTKEDANAWKTIHSSVYVIPNLVHLNDTKEYSRCGAQRAIYVGRYCNQKGLPELLSIWTIVHQRHPEWILDMYGDGELDDWLRRQIADLNIGIRVNHPVKDVFRCYINSSVMLLTSTWEPFGLVLPEAMSCGIPVVSFAGLKGPDSIITDGVDGYLVKNRSVDDFADRVCLLIENPRLRQEMGKKAILSSQRYKAENIMPMWKDLFESLIKR